MQANPADDAFGKRLLGAGVSAELIKAWSIDPQVREQAGCLGFLPR